MIPLSLLFARVFKLGATAYGGPAMIAQIKETAVNKNGWIKEGEFMRGVALCQLIPGATMVQIVTYIGYRVRGIWGALTAAVAFVLPAFIALLILSAIYFRFHSLWFIDALFKGLGAIVVAIILNACITFGRSDSQRLEGDSHRGLILLRLLFSVELCPGFCLGCGCRSSFASQDTSDQSRGRWRVLL